MVRNLVILVLFLCIIPAGIVAAEMSGQQQATFVVS